MQHLSGTNLGFRNFHSVCVGLVLCRTLARRERGRCRAQLNRWVMARRAATDARPYGEWGSPITATGTTTFG